MKFGTNEEEYYVPWCSSIVSADRGGIICITATNIYGLQWDEQANLNDEDIVVYWKNVGDDGWLRW